MTVHLPMVLYLLYGALMAFGFLVFLFLGMVPHWFRKKPQLLLFVMLFLACLITLFMDMYNTYFSDYQSQGRYLMPALVPLMIWIDDGYSSLTAKTSRRVEARLLPSDTPAWNDLAGTVPHQLYRISDSGLLYGILNVFRTSKSAAKNFFLLFFAALLLFSLNFLLNRLLRRCSRFSRVLFRRCLPLLRYNKRSLILRSRKLEINRLFCLAAKHMNRFLGRSKLLIQFARFIRDKPSSHLHIWQTIFRKGALNSPLPAIPRDQTAPGNLSGVRNPQLFREPL